MLNLAWLLTGGFAKGYRTQILGVTTALSTIALWAVGDMTLTDLITKAPVIFGGLGLAALGAKVDDANRPAPQPTRPPRQNEPLPPIHARFMHGRLALSL